LFLAQVWMHKIWGDDVHIRKEDREWLDKAKYYVENEDEKVPAQGKFNAGQKIFYWAMFYGAFPAAALRAFMWFPKNAPRMLRPWMVFVHEGGGLITIGAFIHSRIYGRVHGAGQRRRDGPRVRFQGLGQNPSPAMVPSENRRIAVERAVLFGAQISGEARNCCRSMFEVVQLQAEIAVDLDEDPRRLAQWFPRVRALKDLPVEISRIFSRGRSPPTNARNSIGACCCSLMRSSSVSLPALWDRSARPAERSL